MYFHPNAWEPVRRREYWGGTGKAMETITHLLYVVDVGEPLAGLPLLAADLAAER